MRAISSFLFHRSSKLLLGLVTLAFLMSFTGAEATPTWLQVSAGAHEACGIQTDHTLWCWGLVGRWYGKTSRDKSYDFGPKIYAPTLMNVDKDWQSVTVGGAFDSPQPACALKLDGSRYCWGDDTEYGLLGMGGPVSIDTNFEPQLADKIRVGITFKPSIKWRQISLGGSLSCGITLDNSLYCWGYNNDGELGIPSLPLYRTQWLPQRVGTDKGWASVSVGAHHACALRVDRSRWCWGYNAYGQLGLGDTLDRRVPASASAVDNFDVSTDDSPGSNSVNGTWNSIVADGWNTCGIYHDGSLYCWGSNAFGGIGLGYNDDTPRTSPVWIGYWDDWGSIAQPGTNCGLRSGFRYCWGEVSSSNELAVSPSLNHPVFDSVYAIKPTGLKSELKKGTQWVSISSSSDGYGCGIQLDGALWCWGSNRNGLVGVGDTNEDAIYTIPVRIDFVR